MKRRKNVSNDIFSKDSNKKYSRKIRFYPSFMYSKLDKWLKKMSLSGWHLVDSNVFSFLFEQGNAEEKTYFTYKVGGGHNDDGKYSIPLRYPFLEKTYGVSKKQSKLNKNESKTYLTLEIDTDKIDTENDVGYKELINNRDKLYKKLAVRNLFILLELILLGIIVLIL
ncbi:MAG: DUF2812 domain-containing protein [Clostridia bacterium]|nr:DUF2812 domain-containing protein [Clostridia bacterium]